MRIQHERMIFEVFKLFAIYGCCAFNTSWGYKYKVLNKLYEKNKKINYGKILNNFSLSKCLHNIFLGFFAIEPLIKPRLSAVNA